MASGMQVGDGGVDIRNVWRHGRLAENQLRNRKLYRENCGPCLKPQMCEHGSTDLHRIRVKYMAENIHDPTFKGMQRNTSHKL